MILICDIAKIILPLTTHTKKIFKDPIPAFAGMTRESAQGKKCHTYARRDKGADNNSAT